MGYRITDKKRLFIFRGMLGSLLFPTFTRFGVSKSKFWFKLLFISLDCLNMGFFVFAIYCICFWFNN